MSIVYLLFLLIGLADCCYNNKYVLLLFLLLLLLIILLLLLLLLLFVYCCFVCLLTYPCTIINVFCCFVCFVLFVLLLYLTVLPIGLLMDWIPSDLFGFNNVLTSLNFQCAFFNLTFHNANSYWFEWFVNSNDAVSWLLCFPCK